MPISLPVVTSSGVTVTFHKVIKVEFDYAGGFVRATVASYSDEQAAIDGKPVASHWPLGVPMAAFAGAAPVLTDVENALVSGDGSPFAGGTIISDNTDDLGAIKQRRIVALAFACREQIYRGFESSALGAPHHYPADAQDQANLAGSVLDSLLPNLPADWTTPFKCAFNDEWAYRPHTATQIQQVGAEAKAAILSSLTRNEQLAGAVMAVPDSPTARAEVAAIVW